MCPPLSRRQDAKGIPMLKSFRHVLVPLIVMIACTPTASAEVHVASEMPVTVEDQVLVNPGAWKAIEIGRFTPGQAISATLSFLGGTGDMSAAIVDEANLNFFRQGLPARGHYAARQVTPIKIEGATWSHGQYYLLLDNRHAILAARQVAYRIEFMEKVDPAAQRVLADGLREMYAAIKDEFIFADFDIHVVPCGQPNAFSSPDITLCIELLLQEALRDRSGAFAGVFLHELGHTLLNLWGMPGYDNEDIADEFAAVVMLSGEDNESGARALSEMIVFFSEHDSAAQSAAILMRGGRHAPSIQRVRNLERIMANPAPVIARWNRLLYQHMTDKALKRIAANPTSSEDAALARQVLTSRQGAAVP